MSYADLLAINRRLYEEHRVEVPVSPLLGRGMGAMFSDIYNTADDMMRLAEALPKVLQSP